MAQMAALERLSTELQVQIMLDLDGTGTLYSLIRSSPRLLDVFCANKSVVLSGLARKGFHPSVLLEALSIARLCELPHPVPRSTAINLLNTPIEERAHRLLANRSISRSVTMCKLRNLIDFFIRDYTRSTIPLLNGIDLAIKIRYPDYSVDCALSPSEYGRLQRAFCRFELYHFLFGQCVPEHDRCIASQSYGEDNHGQPIAVTAREQALLFLLRYEADEIAEVHCIRDYLHRRLIGIFRNVQDFAVQKPRASYFELGDRCATGIEGCPWPFSYSGYHEEGHHVEHLTSLGLGYVQRIIVAEGDGDKTTNLMLHGANTCCGGLLTSSFLTEGLGGHTGMPQAGPNLIEKYTGRCGEWSQMVDHNNRLFPSIGWSVLHGISPYLGPPDDIDRGLRKWGYVFWDHERLQEAGVLDLR